MRSFFSRLGYPILLALLAAGFACSHGDTGELSLSLTDAPAAQFEAVYVTIAEVDVNAESDPDDVWTKVAAPGQTYDLLALAGGVREELALASLKTGRYTQMRLIIGDTPSQGTNVLGQAHPFANYVIDAAGAAHELKVPSGLQTGVKIIQGFEINANSTTELILDFDALQSVVVAGASGNYLLKPTIELLLTTEAAILSGTVTQTPAGQAAAPSGQANVSAQLVMSEGGGETVVVQDSSFTSDAAADRGQYKMFLPANTGDASYDLVAVKDGYAPQAVTLKAEAGQTYTQDFALTPAAATGIVNVTISGATPDTSVTVQVLQSLEAGGAAVMLQVASYNFVNGTYEIDLPQGTAYTLVATTPDRATPPSQQVTPGPAALAVTFAFS